MTKQLTLSVNDKPIELDYFVLGFIDHTVSGMIEALEGTGKIATLDITINGDKVTINLNNALVPLNTFASKIVKSTIGGMVSPLKGVSEMKQFNLKLRR